MTMFNIMIGALCVIGFTTICFLTGRAYEKVEGINRDNLVETTMMGFLWIGAAASFLIISYLIGREVGR